MDAGTDQGMTFTSPNWESAPHQTICRITSRVPSHPAGSFYYPELRELPPMATLRLSKVTTRSAPGCFSYSAHGESGWCVEKEAVALLHPEFPVL